MICKISTLGTNSITLKGTHHPSGTNSDVFRKFSTWSVRRVKCLELGGRGGGVIVQGTTS